MAERGGPELSWQTIVGALSAVAILAAAQWTIFQTQFANVEKAAAADRAQVTELKVSFDKYLTIREHTEYREGMVAKFDEVRRRLTALENTKDAMLIKLAHEPVEAGTFQAVAKATDDRITIVQNQLNDINRQIAALLNSILDSNMSARKSQSALPP